MCKLLIKNKWYLIIISSVFFLVGCSDLSILNPKGSIAAQEKDLLIFSVAIMLVIIVPVLIASVAFIWWFRSSNKKAEYAPNWAHSNIIEIFMWGIPAIIILILSIITYKTTIALNPKKAIDSEHDTLTIEVVAMDWQWLFIYPKEDIALINVLYLPVDRPVKFKLTSQSVMNAFYIPQLGTQLDVMSGMENTVNLILNEKATLKGASYNYSGEGFSNMKFDVHGLTIDEFNDWVQNTQNNASIAPLDWQAYQKMVEDKPINAPEQSFYPVEDKLYLRVISQFLELDTNKKHH